MSVPGNELTNLRFNFTSTAFDTQPFSVIELEGFEAISKPFRFSLTLVASDRDIDAKNVLRNAATLQIYSADGQVATPYHGMLAEFHQLHEANGFVFYQAVLVPRFWGLKLWHISEVYLNEQTIPDIITTVLKDGRLHQGQDFEQRLVQQYRPRSYVCEFEESHLDFASRWMEKEGIYYYFDHDGAVDKLVIVDDKLMHPVDAVKVRYLPDDRHDSALAQDAVQSFASCTRPLPQQVVLREFNYRKAAAEFKCTYQVDPDGIGEVMYYGENFRDPAEGNRYAKLRAEEILCGGVAFSGKATAVGLRTGRFMELQEHYRSQFNARYLVTEIHHRGSQAGALLTTTGNAHGGRQAEIAYRCDFSAIPATTQFRPARTTATPRIDGTLTATIDAEGSGQYAELDEFGQYKVQLPFDRSDKPDNKGSARVRMASPYAGTDYGMHFPLHKGTEVLLSFADGNPDAPIIIGAVSNVQSPNQVTSANPSQSVLHTHGGNRLQMEDTQGQQSIVLSSPSSNSFLRIGASAAGVPAVSATQLARTPAQTADLADSDDPPPGNQLSTNMNVLIQAGPISQTKTPAAVAGNFDNYIDGSYSLTVGNPDGGSPDTPNTSANYSATIAGDWNTTVTGGYTLNTSADYSASVGGNATTNVDQNYILNVTGGSTVTVTGDASSTVKGNSTVDIEGTSTTTISGNVETMVKGTHALTVTGLFSTKNYKHVETVFAGSTATLNIGANNQVYLGERGQLMGASQNTVSIGLIMEVILGMKASILWGGKAEYGTLVVQRTAVKNQMGIIDSMVYQLVSKLGSLIMYA